MPTVSGVGPRARAQSRAWARARTPGRARARAMGPVVDNRRIIPDSNSTGWSDGMVNAIAPGLGLMLMPCAAPTDRASAANFAAQSPASDGMVSRATHGNGSEPVEEHHRGTPRTTTNSNINDHHERERRVMASAMPMPTESGEETRVRTWAGARACAPGDAPGRALGPVVDDQGIIPDSNSTGWSGGMVGAIAPGLGLVRKPCAAPIARASAAKFPAQSPASDGVVRRATHGNGSEPAAIARPLKRSIKEWDSDQKRRDRELEMEVYVFIKQLHKDKEEINAAIAQLNLFKKQHANAKERKGVNESRDCAAAEGREQRAKERRGKQS